MALSHIFSQFLHFLLFFLFKLNLNLRIYFDISTSDAETMETDRLNGNLAASTFYSLMYILADPATLLASCFAT